MAKDDKDPRAPIAVESGWGTVYQCPIEVAPGIRCGFSHTDETVVAEHLDPQWGVHRVPRAPSDDTPAAVAPLTPDERTELGVLRAEKVARDAQAAAAASTDDKATKAKE